MSEEINVIWVLASGLGFKRHEADSYWVIRKYKRKTGYSAKELTVFFSNFKKSGKTEKFESFEELVLFLSDKHPTRKNYGFTATPKDILETLERSEPEKREFWKEEIEYLRKLLGKQKGIKPETRPTRQVTLDTLRR
ncbi:hypothetical protein [Thermococcus sp.]|uniref:hypothetical protein n=1 Tax=Thermococcus sp. TaxID=35749 RepID=UPI0026272CCE|nr:hypothetical protein [Thermococcus sp.]